MRALWPLVGCLLYLAARPATSSTNQCVWQDLTEKELSGGAIQIKTKDQEEGELSVTIEQKLLETKKLEPSRLYTFNITCIAPNCSYLILNDDGDNISNYKQLYKLDSNKLIVTGQNLEWSPVCKKTKDPPLSGGGGSGTDQDADNSKSEIWLELLIASGVAVTVVAVGVLTWSICTLCRKNDAQ